MVKRPIPAADKVDYNQWPAIETAFPIAVSSYDQVLKRSDALDSQINTLLIWASASTAAAVNVLATRYNLPLNVWQFYWALIAFALGVAICIVPRFFNQIKLLDPGRIHEHFLDAKREEFMAEIICHAADDHASNKNYLWWKAALATASLVCFAAEAVLLVSWVFVTR